MSNVPTKIISLQFALFFRDISDRPDIEFADINENMMNIFDAIPTIMPIPKEMPSDIPIITQRSNSNEYTCNISRSRIDLHFQRINNERSNKELLADFNAKVFSFINYVLKKRSISRFGIISRYFHEDLTAVQSIKNKYFIDSIGDVAELSLRYNRKGSALEWEINDIVEITAAVVTIDGKDKKGIFVQRDINNTIDPKKKLAISSLRKISQEYAVQLTEESIEALLK